MRKVGLGALAGMMHLRKHNLAVRAMLGAPERNPALEGAELADLIAPGMKVAQQRKQRLGLHGAVAFKMGLHPGPVVGKRIGACTIGAWLLELTRQRTRLLIFTGRIGMHTRTGSSLSLGFTFVAFAEHDIYLSISLHVRPPYKGAMLQDWTGVASTIHSSYCRHPQI